MRIVAEIALAFIVAFAVIAPFESVEYAECGTCGAHVAEWHYVSTGGEPFAICNECYEIWEEQ